jgi:hypothetical protein
VQWLKPVILVLWERRLGGLQLQANPSKKFPSQPVAGCVYPERGRKGSTDRRLIVQASLGTSKTLSQE